MEEWLAGQGAWAWDRTGRGQKSLPEREPHGSDSPRALTSTESFLLPLARHL